MDLSGHDPTHCRVVQLCGLPDLHLDVGVSEMQCRDQPVSGSLTAGDKVTQTARVFNAKQAGHGRSLVQTLARNKTCPLRFFPVSFAQNIIFPEGDEA